jgi:5'(3')-deoxyribonucleotidase
MYFDESMKDLESFREIEHAKYRLYVDMDGTLAEFKVVTYQEQLFEKGYFAGLKPHGNVVDAIKEIIETQPDIEVYALSAYLTESQYALEEKNGWLDRNIPEIDKSHRIFVPCGTDKKAVIAHLSHKDYLLDDYTENLLKWVPPGKAIKLINNINHTHATWKEDCIRYDRSASDIARLIANVIMGRTRAYDTKNSFDQNHPQLEDSTSEEIEISAFRHFKR